MGRPLYSSAFRTSPAVRDPEPPACEKWSYLNAFDPDSDEFFANENVVYEDFIDPLAVPVDSVVGVEEDEEVEGERDMLAVPMSSVSPITSESSSLSDGESPLAVGTEDPAQLVADALRDMAQEEAEPAVRVRLASRTVMSGERWQMTTESRSYARRGLATMAARRSVSHRSQELLPVPTPTAPIPVPSSRRSAVNERPSLSPSTPPRQTPAYISMSPPPTSTPRLYTWARNPSHSSSPSSGGPFTNPHARTSYTHLSPALIRIRDVTV